MAPGEPAHPVVHEVEELRAERGTLRRKVEALERASAGQFLVLREVPRAQAKAEILAYFRANDTAFPSDAAMALRLDAEVTKELCDELVQEGLLDAATPLPADEE